MSGTQRRRIAGESKPELQQSAEPPKPRMPSLRRREEADDVGGAKAAPSAPPPPPPPAAPAGPMVRKPSPLAGLLVSPKAMVLIGVLLLSLAFGAYGVFSGIENSRADNLAGSRNDAKDAAETAAETIFTYQYNKLPQYLSAAQATMTPANAKKFKSVFPAFNKLVPQRQIQMKGVVRNAAVVECGESCSPNKATVLVFLDQARVADGVKDVTVFPLRFKMQMVKTDKRWLVSDIKNL
jgi:hypothetical protein